MDKQSQQQFEDQIILIGYLYGVVCPLCNANVLDLDKKRNQVHLANANCPTCGLDPTEEKQRLKKERKEAARKKAGKR